METTLSLTPILLINIIIIIISMFFFKNDLNWFNLFNSLSTCTTGLFFIKIFKKCFNKRKKEVIRPSYLTEARKVSNFISFLLINESKEIINIHNFK